MREGATDAFGAVYVFCIVSRWVASELFMGMDGAV